MALCTDCNSCNASSVLSNIAPSLPQYPGFKGKVTNPSFILFRSRGQPDRVSASKVSSSADSCSINVSRSQFDTSTVGHMDSVWMVWQVSGWLCDSRASQVSRFSVLLLFVIQMLDLDSTTSALGSIDPIQAFWIVCRWLCCASVLQVSLFELLRHFVVDTLDPDVYRSDLVSSTSEPGSNDPMETFRGVSGWLRDSHASQVSHFDFSCFVDLYRFNLDPAASAVSQSEVLGRFYNPNTT